MAKLTLNSLGLKKIEVAKKEILFNDSVVEVIDYIPTPLKFAIINDTLSISFVNGIFHPVAMEAIFHAILIEKTTNLAFSKGQQENLIDTYDILNKAGLVELVCDSLGEQYDLIVEDLMKVLEKTENKQKTFAEQLTDLISTLTEAINELGTMEIGEDNLILIKEAMGKMKQ